MDISDSQVDSIIRPRPIVGSREQQEAQLRTDPLMQRFAASRRELSADPHRPIYHFAYPEGGLNDPNGLCSWQGQWHLFYQAYPPEDPRQHWGHAVSDDLIHWRDLPYAIAPDLENACFSGATLVENDRVIAMYHGTEAGNMIAIARDPLLLNWEKLPENPVIPIRNPDGSDRGFRVFDPCIWRKGEYYYSLSGGTLPEGPGGKHVRANMLLCSADLKHWDVLHPFVENDRYSLVGDDGACPYFWPIGDRHILLHFSHVSGGKYLLGDYDTARDKFVVTDGGRFNFGSFRPGGVIAPSATPDGRGGVVAIFNIFSGRTAAAWNHQLMSLPRRLMIDDSLPFHPLRIEPIDAIQSLRGKHHQVKAMSLPANKDVVLDGITGNAMEIAAVFEPSVTPMIEMDVLRSRNAEERTRIMFYRERGFRHRELGRHHEYTERFDSLISIDNSYASLLPDVMPRSPETAPLFLESDEPLELRVFVDRSVVEVFANNKQCMALRVYPGRDDSVGVSLRAQGDSAKLRSLDVGSMNPAMQIQDEER